MATKKISALPAAAGVSDADLFEKVTDPSGADISQKVTALQLKTYAGPGFTPENVANKTTDGTLAANSDTLYPSEKAVKTYADTKQASLGFTPENVANKSVDGTLAANSDTLYPSQKAVKTYADTKQAALGFTPENVANKSTDGTLAANSDTLYPSQKAVKTYADTKQTILAGEYTFRDDIALEFFDDYALGAISTFNKGQGFINNGTGSGCTIISATMADGRTHQRLAINAGQYGRKLPWGAFWHRLKVALVLRINNGSNFTNTNGYLGLCSGTTNMVASASTDNFVGIRWGDGTGTSTFTAGTKINFFDCPTFRAVSRRATTTTDRGGLSSGHSISADGGYLSTLIFEISRPVFALDSSSVNYSVAEASSNTTTVQFSKAKDLARFIAESDITSGLANSGSDTVMGAAGVTATPFAFDQSTGVLDTLNISWPQAFNLELALAVRKIF